LRLGLGLGLGLGSGLGECLEGGVGLGVLEDDGVVLRAEVSLHALACL
jgi:hypothetical protein